MRSKPTRARRSAAGDELTELVLKVFRLNGQLLAAADRITEGTRLSAARWQVLGAVLPAPLTVAGVARSMGLTRQSVQRLADVLVAEGICEYRENPAHRRAKLLAPTSRGLAAIERIHPIQVAWADRVGAKLGLRQLETVNRLLSLLISALDTPEGSVVHPVPARAPGRRRAPASG